MVPIPLLSEFLRNILQIIIGLRFLIIPALLFWAFWTLWVYYLRANFLAKTEWLILEIKLPREILKGPGAMEVVLNMLHQTRDGNLFEMYWQGFLRTWFSLEVVSIGGEIHFFVYTQKFFKKMVESQIYAQYPDVEIVEVDDYTKDLLSNGHLEDGWKCWGTEFKLTEDDVAPIKTYVDYGLHELATKEEQKTDPLTSFIEFAGSLKDGEQLWFQILIRATKSDWKDRAKKVVKDKMGKREILEKKTGVVVLDLSPGEQEAIKAIERSTIKHGFDVLVRSVYFAEDDKFNFVNVASLLGVLKQYNAAHLNGFKPTNTTSVDYPPFKNYRTARLKKIMLDAYTTRACFYPPHQRKTFVLNTEELATIFHFPGKVAETPTFGRIEAKKSEPPSALPV